MSNYTQSKRTKIMESSQRRTQGGRVEIEVRRIPLSEKHSSDIFKRYRAVSEVGRVETIKDNDPAQTQILRTLDSTHDITFISNVVSSCLPGDEDVIAL